MQIKRFFALYLSHRWSGLLHHMPREQEERTEQILVTSLLSLVSTLTGLWSSWSFPEPPLATCSKRTACKACPKEKERSPFLKMMMFLLNTGAKPSLFSSREEILGIFMKLHYDCQVVLACKPSFYIGMTNTTQQLHHCHQMDMLIFLVCF